MPPKFDPLDKSRTSGGKTHSLVAKHTAPPIRTLINRDGDFFLESDPSNWLREYNLSRYLRKADEKALQDRIDYITSNLWSTDYDGNVIPARNSAHRAKLLELYAHTVYERDARHKSGFLELDERALRAAASARYQVPKLKQPFSRKSSCLTKFGKKQHILPALERGILRVAPASSYDDPSLNPAQKDDELQHLVRTPNQHIIMTMKVRTLDGEEKEIVPEFGELFRGVTVSNFYVWCCGEDYDARLFQEFEADAALIIHDTDAFTSRLRQAVAKQLPTSEFEEGSVGYYDPYITSHEQLTRGFSKHVRYLYQHEHRFIWRTDGGVLAPFYVELGPLLDVASVLEIDDSR